MCFLRSCIFLLYFTSFFLTFSSFQVAEKIKLGLEYIAFKIKNGWERYDFETCRILYEEQRRMKAWSNTLSANIDDLRLRTSTSNLQPQLSSINNTSYYNNNNVSRSNKEKGKKPIYEIDPPSNSIFSYSTPDNYLSNINELSESNINSMNSIEPLYIEILPNELPPMIFDNVEDIAMFIPATSKIPEPKSTGTKEPPPVISEAFLKALEKKKKTTASNKKRKAAPTTTTKRSKSKRSRQEKPDEGYGIPSSSKVTATLLSNSATKPSNVTPNMTSNVHSTSMSANINVSPNTFLWNELWDAAAKQNPENAATSESPGEIFHRLWAEHRDAESGPTLAPMGIEPLDSWSTTDLIFSDSILSQMSTAPPLSSSSSSSSSQPLQPLPPLPSLLSHLPNISSSSQPLSSLSPMQTINPTNPHTWPSISIDGPQEPPRTPPHQIRSVLDNHSTPGSAFSISEFINMSPDKPDNH